MRFKAVVESANSMIRMLTALHQMSTNCLLVISLENWKFNVAEKYVSTNHPQCYSLLPIGTVFSHYIVESKADNRILLQINIKNLLSAFKSVKEFAGGMTILKLTKKNHTALLSFEMWNDDGNDLRVNLIQDVPVKPIQISKLYLYEEPFFDEQFDASSLVPPIHSIKTVIERMKIISTSTTDEATLYINTAGGKFMIECKTDQCKLRTIYQNVRNDSIISNIPQTTINQHISAKINLKCLLKVIQSLTQLQRSQSAIAIKRNVAVVIHCTLSDALNEEENINDDNQHQQEQEDARITFYLCVYVDNDQFEEDEQNEPNEEEEDDDEKSNAPNFNEDEDDENDEDHDMNDANQ